MVYFTVLYMFKIKITDFAGSSEGLSHFIVFKGSIIYIYLVCMQDWYLKPRCKSPKSLKRACSNGLTAIRLQYLHILRNDLND